MYDGSIDGYMDSRRGEKTIDNDICWSADERMNGWADGWKICMTPISISIKMGPPPPGGWAHTGLAVGHGGNSVEREARVRQQHVVVPPERCGRGAV